MPPARPAGVVAQSDPLLGEFALGGRPPLASRHAERPEAAVTRVAGRNQPGGKFGMARIGPLWFWRWRIFDSYRQAVLAEGFFKTPAVSIGNWSLVITNSQSGRPKS
jgi:hypothetical protein